MPFTLLRLEWVAQIGIFKHVLLFITKIIATRHVIVYVGVITSLNEHFNDGQISFEYGQI